MERAEADAKQKHGVQTECGTATIERGEAEAVQKTVISGAVRRQERESGSRETKT